MWRKLLAPAIVLSALLTLAPASGAAIVPVRGRVVVVRPFYGGFYGGGWWGWGPGWYGGWWGSPYPYYYRRPYLGEVKIKTHMKQALVYVDGGYAGLARKLKKFPLRPGPHTIQLRAPSGRQLFSERITVIPGKTVHINTDE